MNRRSLLQLATLFGMGGVAGRGTAAAAPRARPIILYCDLAIDPAREQEMLDALHTRFRPAAESFRDRGFLDLKMNKVRQVIQGGPPLAPGINYRFQITYASEDQRQVWIKSDLHQQVWPLIEATVLNKDYLVLLTDSV